MGTWPLISWHPTSPRVHKTSLQPPKAGTVGATRDFKCGLQLEYCSRCPWVLCRHSLAEVPGVWCPSCGEAAGEDGGRRQGRRRPASEVWATHTWVRGDTWVRGVDPTSRMRRGETGISTPRQTRRHLGLNSRSPEIQPGQVCAADLLSSPPAGGPKGERASPETGIRRARARRAGAAGGGASEDSPCSASWRRPGSLRRGVFMPQPGGA